MKGERGRGGSENRVDTRCSFKRKKNASGMICISAIDLVRCLHAGKKRERLSSVHFLSCVCVFFYLLDLTGQSWAVLFFSWR